MSKTPFYCPYYVSSPSNVHVPVKHATKTISFIAHTHAKHPVHVYHVQYMYYFSLQRQMSVFILSVIFLSKVQLCVSRTAINNQFSR